MSSLQSNIRNVGNKEYLKNSIDEIELRNDKSFLNDIFNTNNFRGINHTPKLDKMLGIDILKPIDFNRLFFWGHPKTLTIYITYDSYIPNVLCIRFQHLQEKYGIKKVKFIAKDNSIGFRNLYLAPDCDNSNEDKFGVIDSIENYEFEVEGKCIRNYVFQNFKVLKNLKISNNHISVDDNGIKYPVFTSSYPELREDSIGSNYQPVINMNNIKNFGSDGSPSKISVKNEVITEYITKNGIQINDIKGNSYLGLALNYDYYEPTEYDTFGYMIKYMKHSEHLQWVQKKVNFCKPEILPKHIKFNLKGTNIIING